MSKANDALAQLKARTEPLLLAKDIAPVLGLDAHSIRLQAEEDPSMLGFSVIRCGNRTLIPRIPFIRYIEGG